MNFQTLASSEAVDKIRCTSCKNYLSHFPVTISQDHILCGRCPSSDVSIRNVSFEALAQFIRFPCRYEPEGCCEELLPEEIPYHEENCEYQVILCPLSESVACGWQGPPNNLLEHCHDSHSDLVLKNKEFDLDLTKSENVRNVLEHKGAPLFLERKFDAEEKKLEFALCTSVCEPKMKNVPYLLEIACGDKSVRVKFYASNEAEYDLKELNLVSIIDTSGDEELQGAKGRMVIKDPNVDMLLHFKCIKCPEFAVPLIFCSEEIGLFCFNCEQKYSYVKEMLNYPCKYITNGCTYVAKPQEIIKHQSVCEMQNFACPCAEFKSSGCTWNGTLKNVTDHIQSSHSDVLFLRRNGCKISGVYQQGFKYSEIIKFANRLFRSTCYISNITNNYYFVVQVIGPCSDYFEYEIEILADSTKTTRLLARKACSQMTTLSQLYTNSDYYCFFVKDQMTHFIVNNTVAYKVNIFK